MSKRCQNVKKMSNVKKSNTQTMEEVHKKINSHNEVHTYWCQFWCQIWRSPKLFKNTFYAHFEGFWSPSYATSKLTSMCEPHYVNLFFLWTSSIVHVFAFLTFDIFLTTWHLFDSLTCFWQLDIFLTYDIWETGHMGNGTHGQRGIMVNIKDWDVVPWGMGHMGDGAHGQLGTWS